VFLVRPVCERQHKPEITQSQDRLGRIDRGAIVPGTEHCLSEPLAGAVGRGSPPADDEVDDVHLVQKGGSMASSKVAQRHPKAATRGSLKPTASRAPGKTRSQGASGGKESAAKERIELGYVRIKLGSVTLQVKALGIGAGRIALPKMIQKSRGLEDAFLVRNIRNPTAPEVLVINPAALDQELRRARPGRTLGEIVDMLHFNRQGVPRLVVRALPDAGLDKRLRLPAAAAQGDRAHQAHAGKVSAKGKAQEG
jgi:hypothetical protein